MMMEKTA